MDQLCLELLERIFESVNQDDLRRLSTVCKQFYYAALKMRWKERRFWPIIRIEKLTEIGNLPIQRLHSMDILEYSQGNFKAANAVIRQIESLKVLYLDHYGIVSKISDILDLQCHVILFASMIGGLTASDLRSINCTISFEGYLHYMWSIEELKTLIGLDIDLFDFSHITMDDGYDNRSLIDVVKRLNPKMARIRHLGYYVRFSPQDIAQMKGIRIKSISTDYLETKGLQPWDVFLELEVDRMIFEPETIMSITQLKKFDVKYMCCDVYFWYWDKVVGKCHRCGIYGSVDAILRFLHSRRIVRQLTKDTYAAEEEVKVYFKEKNNRAKKWV